MEALPTIAIAKKEGWYGKNGSKWQSIPQQMLMYRAGSWWTRAYAPELSMGLHTADEVADIIDVNADGTIANVSTQSVRSGTKQLADIVQAQAAIFHPTAQDIFHETPQYQPTAVVHKSTQAEESFSTSTWEPSVEEQATIQSQEIAEANEKAIQQPRTRHERTSSTITME